jgi:Mg-chelatase subunit ChlD
MTAAWIRRDFGAVGVTQSPPGRHLNRIQQRYGGRVLLCIDVSGSMMGTPLAQAVAGGRKLISEAVAAGYQVGLILWHHGVDAYVPLDPEPGAVEAALAAAHSHGGNDILPTLRIGIRDLGGHTGDRVMAIFGDGDIGPVPPAQQAAKEAAALGIRIIVRGLGEHAARQLRHIATEADEDTMVRSASEVSAGIASMARQLGIRGR